MDKRYLTATLAHTAPFESVPAIELDRLVTRIEVVTLPSGESYHLNRDSRKDYVLPLRGLLILRKEHELQRYPSSIRLPLGALWPVAGNSGDAVSTFVEAVDDSLLGFLSRDDLEKMDEVTFTLHLALVQSSCLGWNHIMKEYSQRVRVPLSAQIARLLLELKQEENEKLIVPYTHQQLAKLLGTYRETVSLLIGQLRRKGWVETRRRRVCLLDVTALAQMAKRY